MAIVDGFVWIYWYLWDGIIRFWMEGFRFIDIYIHGIGNFIMSGRCRCIPPDWVVCGSSIHASCPPFSISIESDRAITRATVVRAYNPEPLKPRAHTCGKNPNSSGDCRTSNSSFGLATTMVGSTFFISIIIIIYWEGLWPQRVIIFNC